MSNVIKRILLAAIVIPLAILPTFLGPIYFWGFVLFVAELLWWEYCKILKERGFSTRITLFGYFWIVLVFVRTFQPTDSWLNTDGLILLLLLIVCLSELHHKDINFSVSRMSVQFFGALYIGLCSYSVYLVCTLNDPIWKIMIPFFLSIWLSDIFAFIIGTFFGKHLLYPIISPNKTIEGAIAGFIGSVLGFSTYLLWSNQGMLPHVIILGAIIGVVGPIGDLIESMIKRWADVKNSSALLPGHGGIFDRVDSLLLSAPFVVLYFGYLLKFFN